ncbi:MAG TPA: CRTAC1 family protein, partial [Thermoanaerobaculia bacterium]
MKKTSWSILVCLLLALPLLSQPRQAQPARPAGPRFTDVTAASGIKFSPNTGAFGKKWLPETMGPGGV